MLEEGEGKEVVWGEGLDGVYIGRLAFLWIFCIGS